MAKSSQTSLLWSWSSYEVVNGPLQLHVDIVRHEAVGFREEHVHRAVENSINESGSSLMYGLDWNIHCSNICLEFWILLGIFTGWPYTLVLQLDLGEAGSLISTVQGMVCIIYFFVTMVKYPEKSNLRKTGFSLTHNSRWIETNMAGNTQLSHFHLYTGSRDNE